MMNFEEYSEAGIPQRAGRERIMEILIFLLAEMRQNKQITDIDLRPLSTRGFSQTEISTAFTWLFDKIAISGLDQNPVILSSSSPGQSTTLDVSRNRDHSSFRVYHEVERSVLHVDAQGYLLQLRELGLVSDNDLELVIDRVMMSGVHSISLQEVKDLVNSMIFDFDDSARMGSRMMLSASDRVQ